MVTWHFLGSKRKLEIPSWLTNQGLGADSYDSFLGVLESLGVQSIEEAEYREMFPALTPRELRVAAQEKKDAERKAARLKNQAETRSLKTAERKAARAAAQAEKDAERKAARLAASRPSQTSESRSRKKHQPKDEADV